ncbi:MAG: hypothetical protein DRQ97_08895 [Gammaproteobacteria bacterium]|nr:MAG: hypothetical protein DRQ97_08895 [Gammaproteobacteria bacterium]
METIDIEIRTIDQEVQERIVRPDLESRKVSINSHTEFTFHKRLETDSAGNCFVEINNETVKAKKEFSGLMADALGSPIGSYSLSDVYILGRPGIIVDLNSNVCWIGYSLGWNLYILKRFVDRNNLGKVVDDRILRVNRKLLEQVDEELNEQNVESAHLISAPGFGVYGHWLVDTVSRLHFLSKRCNPSHSRICCPPMAPWGIQMCDIFGLDLSDHIRLSEEKAIRVRNLDLFSCIKSSRVLDSASANAAWDVLRGAFSTKDARDKLAPVKIYVSRARLGSDRKMQNAIDIEGYFRKLGWHVIHPEELSLQEQATIFSRATVIVGDDGSALHNSIYSRPGTTILCLDFHRENMLHASFANALEHKLAYLRCDKLEDIAGRVQWKMPISRLHEAISLIEAN